MVSKIWVAPFAALLFTACGASPLLHHLDAQAPEAQPKLDQTAQGDCPLAFPRSGLCASLTWNVPPGANSDDGSAAAFTLRFWDAARGNPAGPYEDPMSEMSVKLWMPSMGHGSSPVHVERKAQGEFAVTQVYFIMPGAWQVRVQLKSQGQLVDEAIANLKI